MNKMKNVLTQMEFEFILKTYLLLVLIIIILYYEPSPFIIIYSLEIGRENMKLKTSDYHP